MSTPVALIILDGWGLTAPGPGNAADLAHTPTFDAIRARYAHTQLEASGRAVGLPEGQMGNSEVGHLNLGAGRVVMQKQTYIQSLIESGAFMSNPVVRGAYEVFDRGGTLHLLGLVSDGGVHSDLSHFNALLDLSQEFETPRVRIHVFTDGRDVGPSTAKGFMQELQGRVSNMKGVEVATVCGRYYAMDRDKRWDRVQRAYEAIVCGEGEFSAPDAVTAVQAAYDRGESDEFIKPTVIVREDGLPKGRVRDHDAIFFFNFRADRARELTYALLRPDFADFARCEVATGLHYASMMAYADDIAQPYAFALPELHNGLAEVLATHGKTQYHSAETEKYPHVTYFFNAMREKPYVGEERTLIPSPKVATYDLQPEMSAPAVTAAAVERIRSHDDDFILINFANPDMVGHTGVIPAAIAACEATDRGLGQILEALRAKGGKALIVADHGNCEVMLDEKGGPHTAHTTNPVPCILVDDSYRGTLRSGGRLGDVAPTLLALMGLPQPAEMTGVSLLQPAGAAPVEGAVL